MQKKLLGSGFMIKYFYKNGDVKSIFFDSIDDCIYYGVDSYTKQDYENDNELVIFRFESYQPFICAEGILDQISEDYYDDYGNDAPDFESPLDNLNSNQIDELQELLENTLNFWLKAHEIEFEEGDTFKEYVFSREKVLELKKTREI